jgi:hypothetical protein
MDFDEERDYADEGPLTDMDMEQDTENLTPLLKHINLTPDSIMQRAGVPMLYDSASNPALPLHLSGGQAPSSFRASSAATVTPLSHSRTHTASRTIGVLDTPPQTRSGTGAHRQQALRGEHLDVALRPGPLQDHDGVYC